MLRLLHIENLAVISECDIEFFDGFNVLTGETGAGKSIVIDAISTILGERTTRDVVRYGQSRATVSAVFMNLSKRVRGWILENGYDCSEDELIIQREISIEDKNTCRINGKPITVSMLKELGSMLINVHGQHDSQQLLNPDFHPAFLDGYSRSEEFDKLTEKYRQSYEEYSSLSKELASMDINETERLRRIDVLTFQIDEIQKANLKPEEDETLLERKRILQNAEKLIRTMEDVYNHFYGDEQQLGILSGLDNTVNALGSVKGNMSALDAMYDKALEFKYLAEDMGYEIRDLKDSFSYSPDEINEIELRIDLIYKLKQKYGNTVNDILAFLENAKIELEKIEFSAENQEKIKERQEKAKEEAQTIAQKLYHKRKENAEKLQMAVLEELSELDMGKVAFEVLVELTEEMTNRGMDRVDFLISTNAGEPLKPLNKVASGGELSRIMLALKNVLATCDEVETLIFDEVDTGVSGRAAQRVGEKIAKLSKFKQIICVTHLAQIAAMSDVHFSISKSEQNERTFTNVTSLDKEGRINELTRIMAGDIITQSAILAAKEILMNAEKFKKEIK